MEKLLKRLFSLTAIAALSAAAWFFFQEQYQTGGSLLTLFWLLLAFTFMQYPSLKKFTYTVFILAAVTIAMTYPERFLRIGDFELKKLIVPLLQLITFGVGCTLSWKDLAAVAKIPKAVAVGVTCHFVIMPVVGFALAHLFVFPPEIAAGVIMVGCMPSGLASNVIAYLAKANLALSVTITILSTLLSPFLSPLLIKLLANQFVPISFWELLWDIMKILIIPIGAGLLFNQLFAKRGDKLEAIMSKVSMVGIGLIIIVITATGRNNMLQVGGALMLAMFLHMTIGCQLGYWGARLFGLNKKDSRTVAIEVGMQNGGLASGLAAQMGKIATVGLASAVNGPIMNVTFSLIGSWWGSKQDEKEREKTTNTSTEEKTKQSISLTGEKASGVTKTV